MNRCPDVCAGALVAMHATLYFSTSPSFSCLKPVVENFSWSQCNRPHVKVAPSNPSCRARRFRMRWLKWPNTGSNRTRPVIHLNLMRPRRQVLLHRESTVGQKYGSQPLYLNRMSSLEGQDPGILVFKTSVEQRCTYHANIISIQ